MEQIEEVDARKMEPMEQVLVGKKERPETVAGMKELTGPAVAGMKEPLELVAVCKKEPLGPAVVGNEMELQLLLGPVDRLELDDSVVAGKTEPLEPLAADKKEVHGPAAGETEQIVGRMMEPLGYVVDRTRSLVAVVAGRRMKQSVVDDLICNVFFSILNVYYRLYIVMMDSNKFLEVYSRFPWLASEPCC
jgi:hypothetical protein